MFASNTYTPSQMQIYTARILDNKCLPCYLFERENKIRFEDDISTHIEWVFNNIYKVRYPNANNESPIARYYHGIQHVTRAAIINDMPMDDTYKNNVLQDFSPLLPKKIFC